jgi:gamma-glutamylcyclotransferase (GGCT)/AIG2-like uncharacterized protein YtfP
MQNAFLFVYGTLLDDGNELAGYLKNNSGFYSEGKINGRLYDIGEYPGAILSSDNNEYVYGNILKLNDTEKVLLVIDDYEGYGDEQVQPNLFRRVLAEALTETGRVNCWVYVYNLSVDGLPLIKSGRY